MQGAAVLAERGHDVSLYEMEEKLGGQWVIASAQEVKKGFSTLLADLTANMSKHGVKTFLGTEANSDLVAKLKPDAVVLATGASPLGLNVPGVDGENVAQAIDVIMGKKKVGQKVAILGAATMGIELAIEFAEQGKEVSLISRGRISGKRRPIEIHTYQAQMRKLIKLRVPMYSHSAVFEITGKGVQIEINEGVFFIEADTVILAVGVKSRNGLAEALKGIVPQIYQIGDCVEPGDARTATNEATTIALEI